MTTYPTGGYCSRCGSWPCRCGQSTATVNVTYDPMILNALLRIEALLLKLVEVEATEDSPRSELCDFIPTPEMHGEVVCQRCGSEEHGGDVDYSGCADCREPAERLEGSSS